MKEKFFANLNKYKLIENGVRILLALSGGADSMSLLKLLIEAKETIDFDLIIAHVNHGVRGEEALRDQEFTRLQAEKEDLSFFTINVDMEGYAKKHSISPEEAGRELRYGFFREILRKEGGGKIALAHNLNDQAETLLMRIIRGTGIDGLSGMDFSSQDIIRPILNISRREIEDYINENQIATVLDSTNLQSIYSRNKIRLELIPYIEKEFNPQLATSLWRLAENSKKDSKFLEEYANKRYNELLYKESKDCIIIDGEKFKSEDQAIQGRIIRQMIGKLADGLQGFGEEHISSCLELFLKGQTGKKIDLGKGIQGQVSYNKLIIKKEDREKAVSFHHELELGRNDLKEGGALQLDLFKAEDLNQLEKNKHTAYFDYDKIKGQLTISNRKAGDYFVPFGMKGRKKLKDYFIDQKIDRSERDKLPILRDGESIVWLIGHRTSNLYRLSKKTKKVLRVKYFTKNEED